MYAGVLVEHRQLVQNHIDFILQASNRPDGFKIKPAAQGDTHPVTAVELSRQALLDFAVEQNLDLRWRAEQPMEVAEAPGLTLLCGDYFAVTAAQLAHIRLVYDRAALVALPAPMRERYVAHMRERLPAGWGMLLLTFDYPQEQRPGPPFSVSDAEVRRLFQGCTIEVLSEEQVIDRHPGFRQQGLTSMIERAYRISD